MEATLQHTIDKDQPTTVKITVADDTWDILKDVSVTTQNDYGVLIGSTASNTQLTVNGTVEVATMDEAAVNATADEAHVIVGASGHLIGEKGLNFFGTNDNLVNHGLITGKDFGVFSQGINSHMVNSGTIASADGHAVEVQGNQDQLANHGVVRGDIAVHIAETVTDQMTSIFNDGTLRGTHGAIVADETGTGQEIVDNRGVIKGNVSLGAANDYVLNAGGVIKGDLSGGDGRDKFTLFSGKVTGDVLGGEGNDDFYLGHGSVGGIVAGGNGDDTYRVDHADAHIVEKANQGDYDALYAETDYQLGKNVHIEYLEANATGISLTGNNLANYIVGSLGDEHLSGGGGTDVLKGLNGSDILTGGLGSDNFVFQPGDGVDHVTDFTAQGIDQDHINLTPDFGIESFHELKSHLSQHGDNVVMNLSFGDKVIFDHVTLSDLSAANFSFDTV
jgi:Ca2+-binding RTX toxin-like protein